MNESKIIGVDLGATNVRGAHVEGGSLSNLLAQPIRSEGTMEEVLEDVLTIVDQLMDRNVTAIGIGVPSVVDAETGILYDVQYIPSWKEVHLKSIMEDRYKVPVWVNNDANCFALGEFYYGKGKGFQSMIGLTIGTGLGAGVVINGKLYWGTNCGAGEFGMVDYLDKIYEYYASGSFFENVYHLDGGQVFLDAQEGDATALKLYRELGAHLGNAVKMILYTYDPELIILGGGVSKAFPFFQETMWERIRSFAFSKTIQRLRIDVSSLQNSGILGAAALYYDHLKDNS